MKKSILSILLALLPLLASAESVEIDGIWYNLVSKAKAAEVTKPATGEYSGEKKIPDKVNYDGTDYSVTSIGSNAFNGCSGLTSVTIPSSVTSIGDWAFSGCSGLTSISVDDGNTKYDSRNNCNAIIEKETNTLLVGCKNTVIPNSVTSIGESAFSGCSGLTSVTIPSSVTSIGDYAFSDCSGLTSVTILNSETSIGNRAFYLCNLESAHIHINDIASWCEDGISLSCRELHLYKNGEEIKDLVIPDDVTSIRDYAFSGCSGLTSVTIPNSVTSIAGGVFSYCSGLTSITIPNSVTSIGDWAFSGCSGLTSITIPDGVTSIGPSAFRGCSGLTTLKIGKGVTSIRYSAFRDCTNLSDVYCYAEEFPSSSDDGIFNNTPINNAALYIPAIHQSKYQSTSPWSSFKYILLLEGATAERCAKPTISLKDGEIIFESETPDASFVSSYKALNSSTTEGNKMTLPNRFRITVFAQKYGLLDSPAATAEVEMSLGKFGDLTGDGQVNVADHVKLSEIIMKQ